MGYITLTLVVLGAIAAFLAKIATKKRMSGALGREVKDHELNSINSWIKVGEAEDRQRRAAFERKARQ